MANGKIHTVRHGLCGTVGNSKRKIIIIDVIAGAQKMFRIYLFGLLCVNMQQTGWMAMLECFTVLPFKCAPFVEWRSPSVEKCKTFIKYRKQIDIF